MDLLDQVKVYKDTLNDNLFNGLLCVKLSGVTYDNRQKFLKLVEQDTPLKLVRDRTNEHDFHAVSVLAFIDESWKDVGFIPKEVNRDIALALDSGIDLGAKVWKKVGGGEENYFYGLTITVKRKD